MSRKPVRKISGLLKGDLKLDKIVMNDFHKVFLLESPKRIWVTLTQVLVIDQYKRSLDLEMQDRRLRAGL